MRAILLESNPDIALMLPCICAALGIPLTAAGTVDAVRRATRQAAFDDIIIVDCSLDRSEDHMRCIAVVRQAALDAHIIYDPAVPDLTTFQREVERAARGDLTWLPATVGLIESLTLLRDLRDHILQARALSPHRPLTEHQQRVWALVAKNRSHAEIAQEIGSSKGAIKQDIVRIKEKLGVDTTEQLKAAHRWASDR